MATRVAINGFGRIGRAFTRLAAERADLEVVAVNVGWYDNEWGYASRLADLAGLVGSQLREAPSGPRR